MYHPIIVLPSSTNCYVFLRKLGLVKVNGYKEQIMVLPVQGLCRCHHSRAPSSPKEPQPKISEQHFLGSGVQIIKKYSKGSHLRKRQSLHLIETCKIWPLKGTSVLSPANCLRYELCEQYGVPAEHVSLKPISVVFRGLFEGLFILTSFRGAISVI